MEDAEEKPLKVRRPPSAQKKMMDLLARRDHSEFEIRQKLSVQFSPEEIDKAIDWAIKRNWLQPPLDLSQKVAGTLHQKHKGIHYINQYLQEKGLPPVELDSEVELEKARELVENKFLKKELPREKMARLLTTRGFDSETIRKVIYEKR